MEIKHFEHYIAVYEERTITAAAKRVSISQQGLSKSIQNIEQEFNTPLFIRSKNRLIPTPFGKVFYTHARHFIDEYNKTMTALDGARNNLCSIKLALANNVVNASNIGSKIAQFQKAHPEVEVKLINENDSTCESRVENGTYDAAIIMGPIVSARLDKYMLAEEQIFVLVHRDYYLSQSDELTMDDIVHEPIISSDSKTKSYAALMASFQAYNRPPNIVFQSNDPLLHLNLVQKKMGISIYPEQWTAFFDNFESVVSRPLNVSKREIFFVTRSAVEKPEVKLLVHRLTQG